MRGKVAVDRECSLKDTGSVVEDSSGTPYSVSLNKVDLETGENSFYILQIVNSGAKTIVFRRWGRLGDDLRSGSKEEVLSQERAIRQFAKLFEERTGNSWGADFQKQKGKYHWVDQKIDSARTDAVSLGKGSKAKRSSSVSTFDTPTKALLERFFDKKAIQQSMAKMDIDVSKMPLANLTQDAVKSGRDCLTKLGVLIQEATPTSKSKAKKPTGTSDPQFSEAQLMTLKSLSNRFYSNIPHVFPAKADPKQFLLDSSQKLADKSQLLDDLNDILLTKRMIDSSSIEDDGGLSSNFQSMGIELESLDLTTGDGKMIKEYATNTHAATHGKFKIKNVWRLSRKDEVGRFTPWLKNKNRKLLWHGSGFTNWVAILSQGLRIAPPEAPVSGYMFGKGVYFADMFTKSANYCRFGYGRNADSGLLCIAEVALGDHYVKYHSEYVTKLPSGTHSTFARGSTMPNPKGDKTLPDGAVIPLGSPFRPSLDQSSSLCYNEFIVYDVSQIRMRYLVEALPQ